MAAPPCGNYGDINGDGDVNILDTIILNQYLAGSITLTADQIARANVKGYGDVSKEDLDLIYDYIGFLITTFPVCSVTNGGIDPVTQPDERSLEPGDYNIVVTKSNYNTVYAKINVSSTGDVSCSSVTGGTCGGTGYPRVEASGTSVKVYMASALPPAIAKCTWISTKDTSKVAFISELILAYNHVPDLPFPVLSKEISDGILMYNNIGTPRTLWDC